MITSFRDNSLTRTMQVQQQAAEHARRTQRVRRTASSSAIGFSDLPQPKEHTCPGDNLGSLRTVPGSASICSSAHNSHLSERNSDIMFSAGRSAYDKRQSRNKTHGSHWARPERNNSTSVDSEDPNFLRFQNRMRDAGFIKTIEGSPCTSNVANVQQNGIDCMIYQSNNLAVHTGTSESTMWGEGAVIWSESMVELDNAVSETFSEFDRTLSKCYSELNLATAPLVQARELYNIQRGIRSVERNGQKWIKITVQISHKYIEKISIWTNTSGKILSTQGFQALGKSQLDLLGYQIMKHFGTETQKKMARIKIKDWKEYGKDEIEIFREGQATPEPE
jgi:hypothetical protein